jgi:uncharacterized protein involved in type VI secretion and phage assembly
MSTIDIHRANDLQAAMAAADVKGIIHVVALSMVIDGKVYRHYESFELQQSVTGHHRFRLMLPHDGLGQSQDYTLADARNLMGKRISVTFSYKNLLNSGPEREFVGVITRVGFNQQQGSQGGMVLDGCSPAILLDGAPHTQSFGGAEPVSLASIVHTVLQQGLGENKFDSQVAPVYHDNLSYSCQYQETHYNYLARMATAYGEWFFYDGQLLHFGRPQQPAPIQLIYGKDTSQVQVQMQAMHLNRQLYGYNSHLNQPLSSGATPAAGLGELGMSAQDQSLNLFTTPSLAVAPLRAVSDQDVETRQQGNTGNLATQLLVVTGKTTVPFLYPACIVDLNMRKPGTGEVAYFSKLLVTSIHHHLDAQGHYLGNFEAIPADTAYLPAPAYQMPEASPQLATVVDNQDGSGRIRVQLDWQKGSDSTDFIRMMSPDAGQSDHVSKNRGWVFIPEVGDQVMVGFVHQHPDRPFVMGAMFHGQTGAGGKADNHLKSIITRSGCTIQLDDTDGQGSIMVTDPSGNSWYMDGAGNITVTAPKNINMNAGENLNIHVGQDMTTSVGMNQSNTVGMNQTEMVAMVKNLAVGTDFTTNVMGKMVEFIQGNKESHTEKDRVRVTNGKIIAQSKGTHELHSEKEVQNNSGEKSKNH